MRLGVEIAEAWGIEVGQEIDCYGFFKEVGELWCIPVDRLRSSGGSPLKEVLALVDAHDEEVDIPTLADLPSAKEIVAPDRLIRFSVHWASSTKGKRFDLALGSEAAAKLGKTASEDEVQVITWKGWLVVMMKARYERAWKEPW